MPDTQIQNENSQEAKVHRGPSQLFLFGVFLWVLCLLALLAGWYQWRSMVHVSRTESKTMDIADDDGRPQKSLKITTAKDGTTVAQLVTKEEEANPWDPAGIEDFTFTDTNAQKVTKQDLLGKPFMIAFVFTHCFGPCPNVTRQMRDLQDLLKDYDFNLVTLTVDPERDSVEVLRNYGKENGANFDRWKFLTGNQADIYGLIHHSFKMPVEEVTGERRLPGFEIIHSTNIMLVDAEGRVTGKYNAVKIEEMSKLKSDLKKIAKSNVGRLDSARQAEGTEDSDGKDKN